MCLKKLCKALLYPSAACLLLLLPGATALLLWTMLFFGARSIPAYISYVLATYTLTVVCLRIPRIVHRVQRLQQQNPYLQRWRKDPRLRVNLSLLGALLWNTGYAALQLGLGVVHRSFWFYALAAYYFSLAWIRFFLIRYSSRNKPGADLTAEWRRYRACGWVFLLMNAAISGMIFYMIARERTVQHHFITTIALAAYTFFTFTKACIQLKKYRRYQSPVFSAAKAVSFTAACVSMLTLESTMLTTFQSAEMTATVQKRFLSISGFCVAALILAMAIYMIVQGTKQLQNQKKEETIHATK